MMDPEKLIHKYYDDNPPLLDILLVHSRLVRDKALACLEAHEELRGKVDRTFVSEAAMLHDIGIFLTDAPSIHCHGQHHYLAHGYLGAELLRREGLPRHGRVAERHTGTGLTAVLIRERELPIPPSDYLPETVEEQLICYADKFYSKTRLRECKSVDEVARGLARYGDDSVGRFLHWEAMFGVG